MSYTRLHESMVRCQSPDEERNMTAEEILKNAIDANPDIRLVIETANRAREIEQMSPPRNLTMATEVISSGYLGSQETQSWIRTSWS
jgi:hypothetical protein